MQNTISTSSSQGVVSRFGQILKSRPVILQLLRFAAIGAINTALDFLILNILSAKFGIDSGTKLGGLNIISFIIAVIQSYIWNRYWAFGSNENGIVKNAIRLVLVGGLGFIAFVMVFVGAKASATWVYYAGILVAFIIAQISLWKSFNLVAAGDGVTGHGKFVAFLVVSAIGLLINSGLVAVLSTLLVDHPVAGISGDLVKNVAKLVAVAVSLVWNFVGYKLIVFRK